MSHSITLLDVETSPRADEILGQLARRLGVTRIWPHNAGRAQLWLQLDEPDAHDAVITALDETAPDWREHMAVLRPHR